MGTFPLIVTNHENTSAEVAAGDEPSPRTLAGTRLAVIGAGVMAEAMVAGMLRHQLLAPEEIVCSHPRPERRAELEQRYRVRTCEDNREAAQKARIVLLSVKPQMLARVLGELQGQLNEGTLVLSIVAGASTAALARALGQRAVVRAMPNTPAQVGAGITVWYATPEVSTEARSLVRLLLSSLGTSLEVEDERQVTMATALSGTGPTYAFLFAEALIEAGVHLGFPRHLARRLVWETLRGSVEFATQSGEHPAKLRDMVTSPGGTSAEALAALERGRFRTVLGDAVWAAFRRTLELEESANPDPGGAGAQD